MQPNQCIITTNSFDANELCPVTNNHFLYAVKIIVTTYAITSSDALQLGQTMKNSEKQPRGKATMKNNYILAGILAISLSSTFAVGQALSGKKLGG